MVKRQERRVIALSAVVIVGFAGCSIAGWGGPDVTSLVGLIGSILASAFAMGCAIHTARRATGRQRTAWSILSVGTAGWVVGTCAGLYFTVSSHGSPDLAAVLDLSYALLPASVCTAAVFVPNGIGYRWGIRTLLDGVIVATALFMVSWNTVLGALFDAPDGIRKTTVIYPIADVAMITIALLLLARSPVGLRVSRLLVTAGLILVAIADAVFLYRSAEGMTGGVASTLGWTLGMYLVGLGAMASRRLGATAAVPARTVTRASLWLPYVPVPFAAVLGTWNVLDDHSMPTLVSGLLLIAATLTRQFLLLDENRLLLATVHEMALRDPLTGLANRALFADRLTHAMQLRLRNHTSVAVLIADLDDFKLVNDTLGHPVGDEMLRAVAERIQDAVNPGDTVARLGGDEFAILVEDTPQTADRVAEAIVRSFDEPFVVDGREVHMRLSVGVATVVDGADPAVTGEELFKRADLAMYSAKRAHAGSRTFAPAMRRAAVEALLPSGGGQPDGRDAVARMELLGDLRHAIAERRLELHYQPKVSLTTGLAVGVEALVRWPHHDLGMLQPADFLPLVRDNGLMEDLTELVLGRAIGDAADWCRAGVDLPVAINLSAPSLDDQTLPARILSMLAERDLPTRSLTVEITEDLLLSSIVRARANLEQLRAAGIRVAIDDFGSGYAAMTYLHELPIDELKLDRQFVAPILVDERAAAIVRSVIGLAGAFDLTVVAEGIENQATAERLRDYGCGFAQGHYFSPPVTADAVLGGIWGRSADVRPTPSAGTRPSSA